MDDPARGRPGRGGDHGWRFVQGMVAFLEQSVVLLLLAFTAGVGTAGLLVGLRSRRSRRAALRSARAVPSPVPPTLVAPPPPLLPEPLLAGAPAFDLGAPPRSRREARTRR